MKTKLFCLAAIATCLILVGCGGSSNTPVVTSNGVIGVWTTTSLRNGANTFVQEDRLANPVVNEVFATFANGRHAANNMIGPDQDAGSLGNDIQGFMTGVAGRSQAITDVVKSVFNKDMMIADLSVNSSTAAYLGTQTGGATGSTFGGRALGDDVVDISLGVVFGTTVSDLGLAPADGNEIPTLTSDNVDASGKHFTSTFPYLGSPR